MTPVFAILKRPAGKAIVALSALLLVALGLTPIACSGGGPNGGAPGDKPSGGDTVSCTDEDGDGFGTGCIKGDDCDDKDPKVTDACYQCQHHEPGCACGIEGERVGCGKVESQVNGQNVCGMGVAVCSNGKWGECIINNSITLAPGQLQDPLTLGPASVCTKNPCDPYCITWIDDKVGLTNDAGVFEVDAGLSIDGGGGAPCVGGLVGTCTHSLCVSGDALVMGCDGPAIPPPALKKPLDFPGVAVNLPVASLQGWKECYKNYYSDYGPDLDWLQAQCPLPKLMLACRKTGSNILQTAAMGNRNDVFFDTGWANSPHDANGVGWYYNNSWSMGFAPAGAPLNRWSCDTNSAPGWGNDFGDGPQRLCWHTGGNQVNGGWRCGNDVSLWDQSWERLVYQSDGQPGLFLDPNTTIFYEPFKNNNAGWQLDTEWNIAPAQASQGQSFGNEDPGFDHTQAGDNQVAGVDIGGNAITSPAHDFYYLTSPIISTLGADKPIMLDYWRWLNSDYTPYQVSRVEVYDGSAWQVIFETGGWPSVTDNAWKLMSHDITMFNNDSLRVRFGFKIQQQWGNNTAQWNVDDVRIRAASAAVKPWKVIDEHFDNNSKGWTLGPEWQIGPAQASAGQQYGNPDPSQDHTKNGTNGVAGIQIGGNAGTGQHAAYYLTSPVVNATKLPAPLKFKYFRWLNSDYTNYMTNTVEVFDGANWQTLWASGKSPGVQENQWVEYVHDVTAYKSANMRFRFGLTNGVPNAAPYSFQGIAQNLNEDLLINNSWTKCFTTTYGDWSTSLQTMKDACPMSSILLSCRQTGDPKNLILAAYANRNDVFFDTGWANSTHSANGVGWYYNDSWSMGFAPNNTPVNRQSCDTQASPGWDWMGGGWGGNDGDQRMCWHTGGGSFNAGWRCGNTIWLNGNTDWEKVVYTTDGVARQQAYVVSSWNVDDVSFEATPPKVVPIGLIQEPFKNNNLGWKLDGEWQIGPAAASSGQEYGFPDPNDDHTQAGDNGIAGIIIGGNAGQGPHAPYYITSPKIDATSVSTPITLSFWRILNSDFAPLRVNTFDVYNGSTWVNLFKTGGKPGFKEKDWAQDQYDLTPYKNGQLQIRYGLENPSNQAVQATWFQGPKEQVDPNSLVGWDLCYQDDYSNWSTPLDQIFSQCNKASVLLSCRPNGAQNLQLAAMGARADVTFDTGWANSTHDANKVGWFYNDSWSMGFAPQGAQLNRQSCDTMATWGWAGGWDGNDGNNRLCWHTGGGAINSGWRCGNNIWLNGDPNWQRLIYHSDGGKNGPAKVSSWNLDDINMVTDQQGSTNCTVAICNKYPYCCYDVWDDNCTKQVPILCGLDCGSDIKNTCVYCYKDATDHDGDGWSYADGDCMDCDPVVNPGAFDFPNTGIDEDCNGVVDDGTYECDAALALNSGVGMDHAKAMGLCQTAVAAPALSAKKWGVLDATLVQANGVSAPAALNYGILPQYGANWQPQQGKKLAVYSSGTAREMTDPSYVGAASPSYKPGTSCAYPPGFPKTASGCALPSATAYDSAGLLMHIRVPTNAKSFSFNFNYFTDEYPEHTCTAYNDAFVALLKTGVQPPIPAANSNNIVLDGNGNLISANGNSFPLPGCSNCSSPLLTGTPFGQNGCGNVSCGASTNWLKTTAPIVPGETIALQFSTWDAQDEANDSLVLIDNFQWSINPATVKTGVSGGAFAYNEGWFTRDYDMTGICPEGTEVTWGLWSWTASTPSDSKIEFYAQTGSSLVDLAAAPKDGLRFSNPPGPAALLNQLAIAQTSPTNTTVGSLIVDKTLDYNGRSRVKKFLRVQAHLVPSTDKKSAPTLQSWNLQADCFPVQ